MKQILIELNDARKETPKQFYGGLATLTALTIVFVAALNIFA